MSDFSYEVEVAEGVTIITCHSNPTLQDLRTIITNVAQNYPYERRMWDLSSVDFNMAYKDLKQAAKDGRKLFTKASRTAILVSSELAYGQANQFRVHREDDNCEVMQFFDRHQAIDWLKTGSMHTPRPILPVKTKKPERIS